MPAACSARNGRGTVDHFGMHGRVDIQVGTLSKAIGALGGYVAGSRALIDFLYHRARPFLFSTSHPPAVTAACLAALDVLLDRAADGSSGCGTTRASSRPGLDGARLQHRPEREPDHAGDRRRRRAGDAAVGPAVRRRASSRRASRFPTVARDKARVRTIVTATHTRDDLQFALDAFGKVGRELGARLTASIE